MTETIDLLSEIQSWYIDMCNDDWEHTYGLSITNIDNPGWNLVVAVKDTYLYEVPFEAIQIQRCNEDDWIQCKVEAGEFEGVG